MADLHQDRFEACLKATIKDLAPQHYEQGHVFWYKMLVAAVDELDIDIKDQILESLELVIEEELR